MSGNTSVPDKRNVIAEIVEDAYAKAYKMRAVGAGSSLEATLPRAIVEREARRHKLSVKEFIDLYRVEYLFNDFGGAFVRFRKVAEESDVKE
ncbi:MAG: hypothetical protein ACLFVA_05380 [Dehalococcoidia bacterium]